MSKIVNSGKTYFRNAVSANQAADIVKAIVCYIPGLNHHAEIPDNSTKPSQVVDTITVKKGAINPHSVVISTPLTAERGNYTFNWVGLLGVNDELIAVETYPDQLKYKTEAGITGNTLVKNIVLQFENAAGITAITTNAETWQLDFTSEFLAAQERERLYNQDFLGSAWFWGDAFKVYKYASTLKIKPGIGYVNGVRIIATGNELNTSSANDIWVEAFNENQVTGTAGRFVIHSRNDTPQSFVDGFNQPHYFFKLADITTGPTIDTDHRAAFDETDLHSLLTHFKNDIGTANTNASTAKTTANSAKTTADSAKTTANSAKTSADAIAVKVNHQTTGLAATKTIADNTKSKVDNATTGLAATKTIADAAKTKADSAKTSADAIAVKVNNATTGLAATKIIADAAKTKADKGMDKSSNLSDLNNKKSAMGNLGFKYGVTTLSGYEAKDFTFTGTVYAAGATLKKAGASGDNEQWAPSILFPADQNDKKLKIKNGDGSTVTVYYWAFIGS